MRPIYVYGDSNSAQWASSPNPGTPWPSRLGTRIVGDQAAGTVVVNRAIGGQRMHYARGQAEVPGQSWPAIETYAPQDLGTFRPAAVILSAGTNDIPTEVLPSSEIPDLVSAFEAFDEWLAARGVPLFVLSIFPMRVTGIVDGATFNARDLRRLAVNQSLRTRFAPKSRFIDADPVLMGSTGQLVSYGSWGDGLHLSAYGHVLVADLLPVPALSALVNAS